MAAIKIKQGEEWVSLPMIGIQQFPDAPSDGNQYGRKDGAWTEIENKVELQEGGSGNVSKQLSPNIFYKFGECTSLTITFASDINEVYNEYMFEFVSGSTPTTLLLPDSIKWAGGTEPIIEANKTYQISIVNNLALIASF